METNLKNLKQLKQTKAPPLHSTHHFSYSHYNISQGFWLFAFLSLNILKSTISPFDTKKGKQTKDLI